MLELPRRHTPLLVALALAWATQSALQEPPPLAAGDTTRLSAVDPELLAAHAAEPSARELRDPFRVQLVFRAPPPPEPEQPPPVVVAPTDAPTPAPIPLAVPPLPSFELVLDAVVAFGGGAGQARINGRSVAVGDTLSGVDAEEPPVLERVEGSCAWVRHRGQVYALDLDQASRIRVGPAPADQEEGAPSGDAWRADAP